MPLDSGRFPRVAPETKSNNSSLLSRRQKTQEPVFANSATYMCEALPQCPFTFAAGNDVHRFTITRPRVLKVYVNTLKTGVSQTKYPKRTPHNQFKNQNSRREWAVSGGDLSVQYIQNTTSRKLYGSGQ